MKKTLIDIFGIFAILLCGNALAVAQETVDLGLSVRWADRNVGSANRSDPGTLFAWGAVEPVPYYDWAHYPHCNGNFNDLTKYNLDQNLGTVDGLASLAPEDDAARVNMGGDWRMPTDGEWVELMEKCDWTIERRGVRVRSRVNGAELFLPFIGAKSGGEIYASSIGYYWTSSLCKSSCWSAVAVSFYGKTVERPLYGRYLGCAVRGVRK